MKQGRPISTNYIDTCLGLELRFSDLEGGQCIVVVNFIHPETYGRPYIVALKLPRETQSFQHAFPDGYSIKGELISEITGEWVVCIKANVQYGPNSRQLDQYEGLVFKEMLPAPCRSGHPLPPPTKTESGPQSVSPFPYVEQEKDIFPFIQVRQPQIGDYDLETQFLQYQAPAPSSPPASPPSGLTLYQQLIDLRRSQGSNPNVRNLMEGLAVDYIEDAPTFIHYPSEVPEPVRYFPELLQVIRRNDPLCLLDLQVQVMESFQLTETELQEYLGSPAYLATIDQIWQSYFALVIVTGYRLDLLAYLNRILVTANLFQKVLVEAKYRDNLPALERLLWASILLPVFQPGSASSPVLFPLPPAPLSPPISPPMGNPGSVAPFAIGDLQMVRQEFERYQPGELAYIENVLRGERKETKRRRLVREEQKDFQGNEQYSENQSEAQEGGHDLREEIQKALAQQQVTQDYSNLTSNYGPPTTLTLGGKATTTTDFQAQGNPSTEEVNRFAKDVLNRTVERISRRVLNNRVHSSLQETEETVTSIYDNIGIDRNVRGIYRWLDKVLKARVVNYGTRLLVEFLVNEPAAGYIQSREALTGKDLNYPSPPPSSSEQVNDNNYIYLAAKYQAKEVEPPPPAQKAITGSLVGEGETVLVVPEGYLATAGQFSFALPGAVPSSLEVIAGSDAFSVNASTPTPKSLQWKGLTGNVPLAVSASTAQLSPPSGEEVSFTTSLEVVCQRSSGLYQAWQLKTYQAICAGYDQQKKAYYDLAGNAPPDSSQARRPEKLREVEKRFLKRGCLKILFAHYLKLVGPADDKPPGKKGNLRRIWFNEPMFLQFFEEIFEWGEMTYNFTLVLNHLIGQEGRSQPAFFQSGGLGGDDLFAAFLEARQGRVLVPVNSNFALTVLYFLSSGVMWPGGDAIAPVNPEENVISLASEIKTAFSQEEGELNCGPAWEVVVPTSFIYLVDDLDLNPPASPC